jgi:hypothetical protein
MNNELRENMVAMIDSMEDCVQKRRILPCLVLLYASLDVMGSLESQPFKATKATFVEWVDNYFLKARPLPCNATELYAARCGILHTLTAESDLSRTGRARKMFYAWGNARAADLAETTVRLGRNDVVSVHVRDLIDAFRDGIARYFQELDADASRQIVVSQRAGLWFTSMQPGVIDRFLSRVRGS